MTPTVQTMTNQHPITPPPELVEQWVGEYMKNNPACAAPEFIATRAAQWGADQELEACCEWLRTESKTALWQTEALRVARRPKPPSLKEQALEDLHIAFDTGCFSERQAETIRRALEQLDD